MKHRRRIRHIFAANVHALLERAEDPVKMLKALRREIDDLLVELESTEHDLRTDMKVIERDLASLERRIAARQSEAEEALAGDEEAAARSAVERRLALEAERDAVTERYAQCVDALDRVAVDRERLQARREEAGAQAERAAEQVAAVRIEQRYETRTDACLRRSRDRMGRIEERLARMEARIAAYDELPSARRVAPEPEQGAATDPAIDAALDELRRRAGAEKSPDA